MPKKQAKKTTISSKPKKTVKKKATTPSKKKKAGRPPKYDEAQKLQKKIDKYFADCDKRDRPYTVSGLAMACDMTRQQLINYSEKESFRKIIQKAKQKIEVSCEELLIHPGTKNVTGIIFNLKNNWGWQDEQKVTAGLNVTETKIIGKDGLEIEIPD